MWLGVSVGGGPRASAGCGSVGGGDGLRVVRPPAAQGARGTAQGTGLGTPLAPAGPDRGRLAGAPPGMAIIVHCRA